MINRIPKALLAAALVCTVSLPCVAESLSLADLENALGIFDIDLLGDLAFSHIVG